MLASRNATLVLVVLSVLVAGLASLWLYRTIARPLGEARDFANRVAGGELDASFDRHSDDEIGTLTRAVANMKDTVASRVEVMREMAGVVIVNADDVHNAARHARVSLDGRPAAPFAAGDLERDLDEVVARAETLTGLAAQMLEY